MHFCDSRNVDQAPSILKVVWAAITNGTLLICNCKYVLTVEQATGFIVDLATNSKELERNRLRYVELALAVHIDIVIALEVTFMRVNLQSVRKHHTISALKRCYQWLSTDQSVAVDHVSDLRWKGHQEAWLDLQASF